MLRKIIAVTAAVTVMVLLAGSGCGNQQPAAADREDDVRMNSYEEMVARQPAVDGKFSPTRENINKWKQTWMQGPGTLAYVYLMAANGQLVGYYILEGPPTSYCATINRPFTWVDVPNDGSSARTRVPAPADDGVYYSGNQCNQYYGFEAVTGAYREWTIGGSLNHHLSNQPLPRQDVEPLGISIEEVQEALEND